MMVHGEPDVHDENNYLYVMKYYLKNIILNSRVLKNKILIWILFVNVLDANIYCFSHTLSINVNIKNVEAKNIEVNCRIQWMDGWGSVDVYAGTGPKTWIHCRSVYTYTKTGLFHLWHNIGHT